MEKQTPSFRNPLLVRAAWYSCIIPFVTAGATLAFPFLMHPVPLSQSRYAYSEFLLIPFCLLVSSLIAGVVSLFGIRKHGVKPIFLKAIIGILASLAVGFAIVLLMAGSSITCGPSRLENINAGLIFAHSAVMTLRTNWTVTMNFVER